MGVSLNAFAFWSPDWRSGISITIPDFLCTSEEYSIRLSAYRRTYRRMILTSLIINILNGWRERMKKCLYRPSKPSVVPAIQPLTHMFHWAFWIIWIVASSDNPCPSVNFQERHLQVSLWKVWSPLHHAGTQWWYPSFNIVSCKQFYDGVIAEFIANDDITNPVFMMKDARADAFECSFRLFDKKNSLKWATWGRAVYIKPNA